MSCTVNVCRISHRIWKETNMQPSRVRSSNLISCCLLSLHFRCDILLTFTVLSLQVFQFKKFECFYGSHLWYQILRFYRAIPIIVAPCRVYFILRGFGDCARQQLGFKLSRIHATSNHKYPPQNKPAGRTADE